MHFRFLLCGIAPVMALHLGFLPIVFQPVFANQSAQAENLDFHTLLEKGQLMQQLGNLSEAEILLTKALVLADKTRNLSNIGKVFNAIANLYSVQGKTQDALEAYNLSLNIQRMTRDKVGEATTLSNMGVLYLNIGRSNDALRSQRNALLIIRSQPDPGRRREATILHNLGMVYTSQSQLDKALQSYQESIVILRDLRDLRREGNTLGNIGHVYYLQGKFGEALNTLEKALPILINEDDRAGQGAILNNIGLTYDRLGNLEQALVHYKKALLIANASGFRREEGITYMNIADIYTEQGNSSEALKAYKKSLFISREVNDRLSEGSTLLGIGFSYTRLGKPVEALKTLENAGQILRDHGDRRGYGLALNNISNVYHSMSKPDLAINSAEQALQILSDVGDRDGISVTLANLGIYQIERGQTLMGRVNLEKSLGMQLETRRVLQRQDRSFFLAQNEANLSTLVDLLIREGRTADAYRWVNVYGTVDLADYSRLIGAKLANPDAQRAMDIWLQRKAALSVKRHELNREPNASQFQQLVSQEEELSRSAEILIKRFPSIAEVMETRPVDLTRLQAGIPEGTVVLQPTVIKSVLKGSDSLALFVLTRSTIQVAIVPLPPKFSTLVAEYRKDLERDDPFLERSVQLYELLIRPVEAQGLLPNGSRVAVINTGMLRDIPMETLFDRSNKKFLIEKHPISYLTRLSRSGSNFSASPARQRAFSQASDVGSLSVFVVANPTPTPVPLPGTEIEADYLVRNFPDTLYLRRDQATLSQFKQNANRFPILHLGTHGCFVPTGCPRFGMKANELLFAKGERYPIAQAALLNLSSTKLLVLSACETARITSDNDVGISGLAYVLERAGARSVVASLWPAPDDESSKIIPQFYANLRTGMDKAEAMRQAKIRLISSNENMRASPSLWAPFIVIGDSASLGK
jgi:CHAT domain-containing protein/Tfp pilus assembly protein PilF